MILAPDPSILWFNAILFCTMLDDGCKFDNLVLKALMTRLTGLLPSVTEETKIRLEKLILELYKFINSEGKLLKESRHNAK